MTFKRNTTCSTGLRIQAGGHFVTWYYEISNNHDGLASSDTPRRLKWVIKSCTAYYLSMISKITNRRPYVNHYWPHCYYVAHMHLVPPCTNVYVFKQICYLTASLSKLLSHPNNSPRLTRRFSLEGVNKTLVTFPSEALSDRPSTPSISVLDVYDIAASIGKEFESIIDKYGPYSVSNLMPKVISVLEELEDFATKFESEGREIITLQTAVHRLELEKLERKEDQKRHKKRGVESKLTMNTATKKHVPDKSEGEGWT
ncbi:unnamed protein product [Schistosoma curassoni]|uniref:RH1 domain-containing protein n=1 Tax=Schistosoma curassoni TaxID=6186 RepID=A0A183JR32_9TREM|nr:unnamed protein product [Schistosoma curassoni]